MLRLPELGEPSQETGSVLLWSPDNNIPDEILDEYINTARDKHGYDMAQALGLLLQNGYNIEEALADLPNYEPVKKLWTEEEKKAFEDGFEKYGKQFRLIKPMLPEKTIHDVIEYYYIWKKTRPDRKRQATSDYTHDKPDKRHKKEDSKDQDEKQPKKCKPCQKKKRRRKTVKETTKTTAGNNAQKEEDQP